MVYSGDDERFEYIYKFVSRDRDRPRRRAKANRELLDHGTLYVARFDDDGSGRWLPLVHGQGPLTAANGFADQGEVLIKTPPGQRPAGRDQDGPARVDRDQPGHGEVYCTLTNNSQRGDQGQARHRCRQPARRTTSWATSSAGREDGDFDALTLRWDHLVLAGDPANDPRRSARQHQRRHLRLPRRPDRSTHAACCGCRPTCCDADVPGRNEGLRQQPDAGLDRSSGEFRRFLTGPVNCEITGVTLTPDLRTMFVNIQHPGEPASDRSDPADPAKYSNWPDFSRAGGRARPRWSFARTTAA